MGDADILVVLARVGLRRAALDDLPMVMRMTVSDADTDDPATAKRARWVQNSARRHRRRALGDCSDGHPDVLVVLARVRLRGLAPATIEQHADSLHARGV